MTYKVKTLEVPLGDVTLGDEINDLCEEYNAEVVSVLSFEHRTRYFHDIPRMVLRVTLLLREVHAVVVGGTDSYQWSADEPLLGGRAHPCEPPGGFGGGNLAGL